MFVMYCDQHVRVCGTVGLSVPLHASKTMCPKFMKFSVQLHVTVAQSYSDNNAICYVLG